VQHGQTLHLRITGACHIGFSGRLLFRPTIFPPDLLTFPAMERHYSPLHPIAWSGDAPLNFHFQKWTPTSTPLSMSPSSHGLLCVAACLPLHMLTYYIYVCMHVHSIIYTAPTPPTQYLFVEIYIYIYKYIYIYIYVCVCMLCMPPPLHTVCTSSAYPPLRSAPAWQINASHHRS
jgi:hypothetical protein